jgi:hypothetical protein
VETRVDAERYAAPKREERCAEHELDRRREALRDQLHDREAIAIGDSEFAPHGAADEARELDGDGIVQSEAAAELLLLLDGRVLAHHGAGRIADEVEHAEREKRDDEHDGDGLQQSAHDERDHSATDSMPCRRRSQVASQWRRHSAATASASPLRNAPRMRR